MMQQNKLMELTPDKWGLLVYLSDHNALDLSTVKRFMDVMCESAISDAVMIVDTCKNLVEGF